MRRLGFLALLFVVALVAAYYVNQPMFARGALAGSRWQFVLGGSVSSALVIWALPAIVFLVANRKAATLTGLEPYLVPVIVFVWQLGPMLIATQAYLRVHGH
jgi:hypothetical protein